MILCIHGFRQNMDIFKQKLGSFRKLLKPCVDFYFINAPHKVADLELHELSSEERSWWFTGENSYVSKFPSDHAIGFDDSIKHFQNFMDANGPFDGLLGFSQGAAFVGMICHLCQNQTLNADLKFVILVAGFKSLCAPHADFYNSKFKIPSLHVIGETDSVISKERSEELKNIFESPEVLSHPGGHYVPASKEYKAYYQQFIQKYVR